nr:DNA-binding response regulator [Burkholderiaceae bacterium]
MIRVLLCDDHRIVREGLRQVLADDADIMVCGEARTGTEALAQVQALMGAAPQGDRIGLDVVLLD